MVSGIADNMQTLSLSMYETNKSENTDTSGKNVKEYYSPKIPLSSKVGSLDDFKLACNMRYEREKFISKTEIDLDPNFDYETEFKKYMESRGCENEKELQALNTTCCETKEQLVQYSAMMLSGATINLHANGFTNSFIRPDEMLKLCSNMSIEDLASYGRSVEDTGSPFADQVNELNAFLSKSLKNNACNDELSQKFSEIIKSTTDLKDEILAFSNKLEEQNLMFRAENERSRVFGEDNNQNSAYQNYPEYKASLIAQYQK